AARRPTTAVRRMPVDWMEIRWVCSLIIVGAACQPTIRGGDNDVSEDAGAVDTGVAGTTGSVDGLGGSEDATPGTTGSGTGVDDTGPGVGFDLPTPDDPPEIDECTVPPDELDAVPCNWQPPPPDDAFNPEVQWDWFGSDGDVQSTVIPLVANLTDDNADGEINLCDVPDVVVLAGPSVATDPVGHLYILDGETGEEHFSIAEDLNVIITPALGDIDNDGVPEIVAINADGALVAFEHDGTKKWEVAHDFGHLHMPIALAIADLDADGSPEIFGDNVVANADGSLRFHTGADHSMAATAVDLDDDGELEVLYGSAAYNADGTPLFLNIPGGDGFPQVADLDGDGAPEIITTSFQGLTIVDAVGTPLVSGVQPTGDGHGAWIRPATVHDFSGDGLPQIAMSSASHYSVMSLQPEIPDVGVDWSQDVLDGSGIAGGTAFDFLGDGVAEAMYADETTMFIFEGEAGGVLLTATRASRTLIEYPVVADIDNDGSAEIVVVSNEFVDAMPDTPLSPTVSVIRNASDKWVPTRRIWNQHTYHVTNVREDGTIPATEPKHWERNNTFRTNAQIADGAICEPVG
ncbi:MAG: FG-GAP-like repeat-containing protein, partial [Myxococcota bacterium]